MVGKKFRVTKWTKLPDDVNGLSLDDQVKKIV
jgi:hypothetical protein